jgi:tRNA threonylcarbamoyladenosine biosynthesis protein TsaE
LTVPLGERVTDSAAQTEELGARLAESLDRGDLVLVRGDLGAGKTTFIRGACRALGVEGPIVSPTFVIGRRYKGRLPVSHLDLYRLEGLEGEDPGLLDDYLSEDTVAFVEWPETAGATLERPNRGRGAIGVSIEHRGGDHRLVTITMNAG